MSVRRVPRAIIFPIATAFADFNVTSTTITAPAKRGFLLGVTSNDASVNAVIVPSLTGWAFRMLHLNGDATGVQNLAVWLGLPLLNALTSASGTSVSWVNAIVGNTFSGYAFRQYDGSFRGDLLDVATTAATASSVVCAAPGSVMRAGKLVALAGTCFKSGGTGINGGSDTAMPDVGSGALCALRMNSAFTDSVPSSTTFNASRSDRWNSTYLVMR